MENRSCNLHHRSQNEFASAFWRYPTSYRILRVAKIIQKIVLLIGMLFWLDSRTVSAQSAKILVVPPPPIYPGQNVFLICSTSGNLQPVVNGWLRNGVKLSSNVSRNVNIAQHLLEVAIRNIDRHNEGLYTCTTNTVINHQVLNASVYLDIQDGAFIKFAGSSNISVAFENTNHTLRCTGRNFETVVWFHDGSALSSERSRMLTSPLRGSKLLLQNVTMSDAGRYICQGIPKLGRKVQDSVTLYIYSKPQVIVNSHKLIISSDESAVFTCNASGSPTPTVRWFAQANGLVPLGSSYNLVINGSNISGSSTYFCNATNKYGSAVARVTLEIKDIVRKINIAGDKPGSVLEESVNIPCITTIESEIEEYYELGRFFWSKGDLTLSNLTPRLTLEKTNSNASLTIQGVKYSDSGVYTCTVVIGISARSWSTRLVVVGPPQPPSKAWIAVSCGSGLDISWKRENPTFDGNSPITGYRITLITYFVKSGNITVRTVLHHKQREELHHVSVNEPLICMNCSLFGAEIQSVSHYGFSTRLFINSVAMESKDDKTDTSKMKGRPQNYCSANVKENPVFKRFPKFQISFSIVNCSCDTDELMRNRTVTITAITIFFQEQLKSINLSDFEITASKSKTRLLYRASVGDGSLSQVLHTTELIRDIVYHQAHKLTVSSCFLKVDHKSTNCSLLFAGNEVTPCSLSEENTCQDLETFDNSSDITNDSSGITKDSSTSLASTIATSVLAVIALLIASTIILFVRKYKRFTVNATTESHNETKIAQQLTPVTHRTVKSQNEVLCAL